MRHLSSPFVAACLLVACASAGGVDRLDPSSATLVAADGERRSVAAALGEAEALVLVWWSRGCPCVARYTERVAALRDRYLDSPVALHFVASNAGDDATAVAAAHAQGRLPLPVLLDPGGRLARHLGVVSTPTVVVVDRAGRVRFHGWIDNEGPPGSAGRQAWLEETLDGLLAGADVARRTPTWGSTITRSLGEARACATPPAADEEPDPRPPTPCH